MGLNRDTGIIDYVSSCYENVSFERTVVIGVQHILPSTLDMFKVLMQNGLNPQHIFLLGKCYSTNPKTFAAMEACGMNVCEGSFAFRADQSFDSLFQEKVSQLLDKALLSIDFESVERIIVIDDGGALINEIQKLPESFTKKVVAIEQTSAGYHRIKDKALSSPVINVARSKAKLSYETPAVALGVVAGLRRRLQGNRQRKILIMGKGVIGQACYQMLSRSHDVYFFDVDPEKSDIGQVDLPRRLGEFDAILGLTGSTSLSPAHYRYLKKDVLLVSGSSSDREFDAIELRKQAGVAIEHCHQDITVDGITLANCGFPVNFSNDFDSVDPSGFQLTRGLLTAAIFQAYLTCGEPPCLVPVNIGMQENLLNYVTTATAVA